MRFVVDGEPMGSRSLEVWAKAYSQRIGWKAIGAWGDRKPMEEGVRLEVDMYFPIPESWPKDKRVMAGKSILLPFGKYRGGNVFETVADALAGICYKDSKQVVMGVFRKFYSNQPRAEIRVEPISLSRDLSFDGGILF